MKKLDQKQSSPKIAEGKNRRRQFIKGLAGIPLLGAFSGPLFGISDSHARSFDPVLPAVNGKLPEGKLGNLSITRMIMGCNLIGGWAHARDLIYADSLFRAYHTEDKIIETLKIAEKAGINTTFMVTQYYQTFNKYKNVHGGKMQSICQAMLPDKAFFSDIDLAIKSGATAIYIQGGEGDRYLSKGKTDKIASAIEYIKKQGLMAGLGAHSLESIKLSEKEGIPVDFYVKTLHHDKYWSAIEEKDRVEYSVIRTFELDHNKYHDNMWDLFPSQTIEYMNSVKKPWFAFKVLAAGAIRPRDGFSFAFENGADFICVGMFDFQIINNVNVAYDVLSNLPPRTRQWFS